MIRKLKFMLAPLAMVLSISVAGVPVIPMLAVSTLVVSQTACPNKETTLSWSKKAVAGLEKALPMLRNAGVSVQKIEEAIDIGKKLIVAFEADDRTTALALTETFIKVFEQVVTETERISEPKTRTLILAILAVVDLAIHFIAENISVPLGEGIRSAGAQRAIRTYGTKKRWQCRTSGPVDKYKAGQYATMETCKKYPDQTQVETR